jgi:hypothetical protein
MLKSGRSLRFTAAEREDLQALGIDVRGVKSASAFAAALEPWLHAVADVRPDLFEKIVREIASTKGIRLPPKLRVVSDS